MIGADLHSGNFCGFMAQTESAPVPSSIPELQEASSSVRWDLRCDFRLSVPGWEAGCVTFQRVAPLSAPWFPVQSREYFRSCFRPTWQRYFNDPRDELLQGLLEYLLRSVLCKCGMLL